MLSQNTRSRLRCTFLLSSILMQVAVLNSPAHSIGNKFTNCGSTGSNASRATPAAIVNVSCSMFMFSVPSLRAIPGSLQQFRHLVAEVALNDNLPILGAASDSALDLEHLPQLL